MSPSIGFTSRGVTLFRSSSFQKNETELVIIVTPELTAPPAKETDFVDVVQKVPLFEDEGAVRQVGALGVGRLLPRRADLAQGFQRPLRTICLHMVIVMKSSSRQGA